MKKHIAATLLLNVLLLVGCSAQPAAVVPTLTPTAISVIAPTIPINTVPSPGETPQAVPQLTPEDQPATEWNGIPIMPHALTGQGDAEGYVFTIRATPQQIREYYQTELGKLGWQPLAPADGDSSTMLLFANSASDMLSVSIIAKGEEALVILGK